MERRYPTRERRQRITPEEADQMMRERIAAIQDRIVPEQEAQDLVRQQPDRYRLAGRTIYGEPDMIPQPLPPPNPVPQRIRLVRSSNQVPFSEQLPPPAPQPKRRAKAKAKAKARQNRGNANSPIVVSESDDDYAPVPRRAFLDLQPPAELRYYQEDVDREARRAAGVLDVASIAPPPFFIQRDINQLLMPTNRTPVSISGDNSFCFLRAIVRATAGTYNLTLPLLRRILNIEDLASLDDYGGIHINAEVGHSGDKILANALHVPVATIYYTEDEAQPNRYRITSIDFRFPFNDENFRIYINGDYSGENCAYPRNLSLNAREFINSHEILGNGNKLLGLLRNRRIIFLLMRTNAHGLGRHFEALIGGMVDDNDPRWYFSRPFPHEPLGLPPLPPQPFEIPPALPPPAHAAPPLPLNPFPPASPALPPPAHAAPRLPSDPFPPASSTPSIPFTLPSSPYGTPSVPSMPLLSMSNSPPPLGTESPFNWTTTTTLSSPFPPTSSSNSPSTLNASPPSNSLYRTESPSSPFPRASTLFSPSSSPYIPSSLAQFSPSFSPSSSSSSLSPSVPSSSPPESL